MSKRYPDGEEVNPTGRDQFNLLAQRYLSGLSKVCKGEIIKGGDIQGLSISFKGSGDILVVIRRRTADSGTPEVHFESAYDLGTLLQALEKACQAERWRPDEYAERRSKGG